MALPRLEFCLSLEVDVSGTETAVIDVLVHGSYRHINLWMICQNLIGRLALIDQRRYNLINRMQFLPRAINSGPGAGKKFCILPLCKPRVITVFLADMALGWCELLRTSIADIGCPIEALTAFALEVRAVLITGWT